MLEVVEHYNELATSHYNLLWKNLKGVTETELDWQPHPKANPVRWIAGHLLWFEEWVPDAIDGSGRYLTDKGPQASSFTDLDDLKTRFDAANDKRLAAYESLIKADLDRKVNYFGAYDVSILALVRTHAGHMAGHRYQIRYVRGIYSRAHETDKSAFDPW